ncbi:hypothetical protein JD844_019468 [Phrynosoma platyrhinos]|uniref:Sodium channel non-voltage-gated 1 beta subunit n=1 Tax=Phrynosoma platyrhinos TaxID=52577 RepID=A0ABQ7TSE6_PHRPL|nr:hypothetical protein JD844_019468 [Phrynosoma platyrhinos]
MNSNKTLNKTDLANLMVFYKDLNERFITENPANNVVLLLSNFGGQLGLWMSCSVVCVIEIVEVFFIDTFCIILRHQWQKAKKWWRTRKGRRGQEEEEEEEEDEGRGAAGGQAPGQPPQSGTTEVQGLDNPACDEDDDLPTFNTAMRLPLPPDHLAPRTPPPNYSTLRLSGAYDEQLPDTLEVRSQ